MESKIVSSLSCEKKYVYQHYIYVYNVHINVYTYVYKDIYV